MLHLFETLPVIAGSSGTALIERSSLFKKGKFRENLGYLVRVIHLIPPTPSNRRKGIPLLVGHIVARYNRLQGKNLVGLSTEASTRLTGYDSP